MLNLKNMKISSKFGWCIAAFSVILSAVFSVKCSDGIDKYSLTLPTLQSGIEKIEYMINGEPQGSIDGKNKIDVLPGSKVTFAVKFASKGYSRNYVRDIEIQSKQGQTLRLNTYSQNESGEFVLMRVKDDKLIDPLQTYISSDYIAKSDDSLSVTGLEEDKYTAKLRAENQHIILKEAMNLQYLQDDGNYVNADFSSEENSFVVKNLTYSMISKLLFDIKEGYTDSEIRLSCGNSVISLDKDSHTCTLPQLDSDMEITIKGLRKNKYSLTFGKYAGASFKFRIAGNNSDFRTEDLTNVEYGDNVELMLTADDNDILAQNAVTINGIAATPTNGLYEIENANENYSVSLIPNENVLYPIAPSKNEKRIKLMDMSGIEKAQILTKKNTSVDFKLSGNDGYSKGFIAAEIYAVPTTKLQNGTYNPKANPEEAKSYLVIPSSDFVYSLNDINQPITLIVTNLNANIYNVHLPKTVTGAKITAETNENVTRITETKFEVKHGSDFKINVSAEEGFDISNLEVGDTDESLNIVKEGNAYTCKNITRETYLLISGAKTSSCSVSFGTPGVTATTETGVEWESNVSSVEYKTGLLKFKVKASDNCTISSEGISLKIESGNGKLVKSEEENNLYFLSEATSNIVLNAEGITCSESKVILKSSDEDVVFTYIDNEEKVLPEENSVPFGTTLNFKIVSTSGKSVDNLRLESNSPEKFIESATISNAYEVRGGTETIMLFASDSATAELGPAPYITLCENLLIPQAEGYNPKASRYGPTATLPGDSSPKIFQSLESNGKVKCKLPYIIFSKDKEALDCINSILTESTGTYTADDNNEVDTPDTHYDYVTANAQETNGHYTLLYNVYLNLPETVWSNKEMQDKINPEYKLMLKISQKLGTKDDTEKNQEILMELKKEETKATYIECAELPKGNKTRAGGILGYDDSFTDVGYNSSNYADLSENAINKVKPALVYLENCYCTVCEKLHSQVDILDVNLHAEDNNVRITPGDNTEMKTDTVENSAKLVANIANPANLKATTCRFTVQLDDKKKFKSDAHNPLVLNENAHAKITEQTVDIYGKSVTCAVDISPLDQGITLNWSSNTVIEDRQQNVCFDTKNSTGTTFVGVNANNTIDNGQGIGFVSMPKEGYAFLETLNITKNQTESYDLDMQNLTDDLSKSNNYYKEEWISLGDESGLLIQGTVENDDIIYKIAAKHEFGSGGKPKTYIKKGESGKWEKTEEEPPDPEGITSDITITSTRKILTKSVTLNYAQGIKYVAPGSVTNDLESKTDLEYGGYYVFTIVSQNGYDISEIQVVASTATESNNLTKINGMYILTSVKEDTTITVNNVKKLDLSLTFNQCEGISYKNTSGDYYNYRQSVPYFEEIVFQIEFDSAYSKSDDFAVEAKFGQNGNPMKFETSQDNDTDSKPYIDHNLYIIPEKLISDDIHITVTGLEKKTYSLKLVETPGVKYYNQYGTEKISDPDLVQKITHNDSFGFTLTPEDGYELSSIEVVASYKSSSKTLIPTSGVYTVENITEDCQINISGIAKTKHNVEFRTVTGVSCIDEYGSTLPSSLTVDHGGSASFYLSFDTAYSNSASTANVKIKGTNNTVPHDSTGKYTISDVTDNKIIEIINVKKNTYKASFVPTEGVIYKTAKGKEFSGNLEVEYGETLYFKISLMDAYDQSTPVVKMNDTKNLIENSGSYCLENISEDVEVTVDNVEKNLEETTIESIKNIPASVKSNSDVNAVIAATNAYNSLSEDDQKLVTNKQDLENAQSEAGDVNHTSEGLTISGVDWNIQLLVTNLTNDKDQMKTFAEKVERRSVLSLYSIKLMNLLTGEEYEIPYGEYAQITMPTPDLTGYKNIVVAHENSVENMEYIDPSIVDGIAKFEISSIGLFGVAAKEIPNYSEDVSDISIAVSSLVEDENELKSLLGENLSSELGHLVDLGDENSNKNSNSSSSTSDSGNSDTASESGNDSLENSFTMALASIGDDITGSAKHIYNWAIDNEFWAVLIILILGSVLIGIILAVNRKKENKEN